MSPWFVGCLDYPKKTRKRCDGLAQNDSQSQRPINVAIGSVAWIEFAGAAFSCHQFMHTLYSEMPIACWIRKYLVRLVLQILLACVSIPCYLRNKMVLPEAKRSGFFYQVDREGCGFSLRRRFIVAGPRATGHTC